MTTRQRAIQELLAKLPLPAQAETHVQVDIAAPPVQITVASSLTP